MKRLLTAVFCVCLMILFVLSGCTKSESEEGFVVPQNCVSVVQVTINPTVNFYLDADNVILAVEFVNSDAESCYKKVENQLVGSSVTDGVNLVIKTAEADGFLDDNKNITIDVVKAKESSEKLKILASVTESAKTFITENNIEAEVVLTESAQKELDNQTSLDNADSEDSSSDNVSSENTSSDNVSSKEEPTNDKTNPVKSLKKDVKYGLYKPQEDDFLLTAVYITFKDNGQYIFSQAPYTYDEYGEGEYITYNGKKYYLAGGGGGRGTYTVTDEKITLSEGFEMVLTMNENGQLVVESVKSSSDFFKVGDKLTEK